MKAMRDKHKQLSSRYLLQCTSFNKLISNKTNLATMCFYMFSFAIFTFFWHNVPGGAASKYFKVDKQLIASATTHVAKRCRFVRLPPTNTGNMINNEQVCAALTCRSMHLGDWQASCSQLAATSELFQHTASSVHIITQNIHMMNATLMTLVPTLNRKITPTKKNTRIQNVTEVKLLNLRAHCHN